MMPFHCCADSIPLGFAWAGEVRLAKYPCLL
jgi:hypothetical protein